MAERLEWARDGVDWPNRAASRFVVADGLTWHVQVMGQGPVLLMLHGTGAATHSWRDFAPLLAERFTLVAPDLPGHGFTDRLPRERTTLPGMAQAIAALLRELALAPALALGHSAGAALCVQMALAGHIAPRGIVALNGALLPFTGWAGLLFAPLARALVHQPLVPRLFARKGHDPAAVRRLIAATGSRIDSRGLEAYARLVRSPAHVAGALDMMAGWDLGPLARALPRLKPPLLLVVGECDRTVPPAQARQVAAGLPGTRVIGLPGLGHLAHEEQPREVAAVVLDSTPLG